MQSPFFQVRWDAHKFQELSVYILGEWLCGRTVAEIPSHWVSTTSYKRVRRQWSLAQVPMRLCMGEFILLSAHLQYRMTQIHSALWKWPYLTKVFSNHQPHCISKHDWDHRYVINVSLEEKWKPWWRQGDLYLPFIMSQLPAQNAGSSRQTLNGAWCQEDQMGEPFNTWEVPAERPS